MVRKTHVVSLYRRGVADSDPYDAPTSEWGDPLVEDLEVVLQPLTGSVQQTAAGREVNSSWKGFLPYTADVKPDDVLLVTAVLVEGAGLAGSRLQVQQIGPQGRPWDTEVLLDVTQQQVQEGA